MQPKGSYGSNTQKSVDIAMKDANLFMLSHHVKVCVFQAYMTEEDHTFQLFSGSATKVLNLWNRVKVGTSVRVPYVLSSNLGMYGTVPF